MESSEDLSKQALPSAVKRQLQIEKYLRVEAAVKAGEKIVEACRTEGVTAASFYYWKSSTKQKAKWKLAKAVPKLKPKTLANQASRENGKRQFIDLIANAESREVLEVEQKATGPGKVFVVICNTSDLQQVLRGIN